MTTLKPEYWPPISHVSQLYNSEHVQLQLGGTYQKQSYLNRCKIAGVHGKLTLSVPILGGREQKKPIKDVLIDYSQNWIIQHLRTLQSCYGKAPFFDYYFPTIESLLLQRCKYLVTLNEKVIRQTNKWLRWNSKMEMTHNFSPIAEPEVKNYPPYLQVFADRQPFYSNLSILDLLFCLGPASTNYLRQIGQRLGC